MSIKDFLNELVLYNPTNIMNIIKYILYVEENLK